MHARQVRDNTLRNCLPKRTDCDWDTRNHSWEVDNKLMLFKYVDQLTLGGNRCLTCHFTSSCARSDLNIILRH